MLKALALVGTGLGFACGVLAMLFLAGMRSKTPLVIDAVRRFNRAFTNPRVLRSAGAPGASASIIRHDGRRTGRSHETPIGAMPIEGGFLIALPYGTRADWVKNVLAAGKATIIHGGSTFAIGEPTVVPTSELAPLLPRSERRLLRIFDVDRCLHARHVTHTPAEPSAGTTSPRR